MKKRKPPILIVTFVIVFAAIAVVVNYGSSASGKPDQAQAPQQPQASSDSNLGQPRALASQSSTADAVKDQMKGTGGPPTNAKMAGAAGSHGVPPQALAMMKKNGGSAIMAPQMTNAKPKPSDGQVSSGWYMPEAHKGN